MPGISELPPQAPLQHALEQEHRRLLALRANAGLGYAHMRRLGFVSVKDPKFGAVGDGETDDTAAILAANTAATDQLHIPDGTFILSSPIPAKSGMTYWGPGTLKLKAGADCTVIKGEGVSNVRVHVNIDGNQSNQTADNPAINFETSDDATQFSNIDVSGCTVTDVSGAGIRVHGGISCRISNNYVQNCNTTAGAISCASDGTADSILCTIMGNTVDNVGGAGIIAMGNGHYHTITGNTIRDWNSDDYAVSGNGDAITAYDTDNDNLAVTGNVCINTGKAVGGHGIHVGGDNVSVTGNTIRNPYASGIYLRGQNNGSPDTGKGGAITGNSIYDSQALGTDNEAGIYVRDHVGVTVSGNILVDCANYGILCEDVSYFSINGNTIHQPTDIGIAITDTQGAVQSLRASITGNTIFVSGVDGIYLDRATQMLVSGNFVQGNATASKYGIKVSANAVRLRIGHNYLREFTDSVDVNSSATSIHFWPQEMSEGSNFTTRAGVASASTISLAPEVDYFLISGTTTIDTINGGWPGRRVTLRFSGACSVSTSGNVSVASAFTSAADDILELIYDDAASKWYETNRAT